MQLTDAQAEVIESIAWDFEIEPTSYSGRGMFGKRCLGLPAGDMRQVARFLVALGQEDFDLAEALAGNLTTDSLGYGTIAYFPRVDAGHHWDDKDEEF